MSTGVRIANAAAATSIAAEPDKVPFIRFNPIANSAMDMPRTVNPLPISFHCIFPNLLIAFAKISRATPTITRPVPMLTMFLGMSLTAIVTSPRATLIAVSPRPIISHCILPKSLHADASIFIAAARTTIPVAVDIVFP